MGAIRRHPFAAFVLIAFGLSWAFWCSMAAMGMRVRQGVLLPTHVPGLFGPFVAAFVVTAVMGGRAGVRGLLSRMARWRVAPRWYVAALSPLLFFGAAAVALRLTGRGWPDPGELGRFSGLPAVGALAMWALLLVTAYAEETGWRGFAVPTLERDHGMLRTALIVGTVWALWHVPSLVVIQNYRDLGMKVLPGFLIGILAGSVFLTWLYDATKSVLIVALWHATYNLVAGTAAAHGVVAAVVSMAVIVWAAAIAMRQRRAGRRHELSGAGVLAT